MFGINESSQLVYNYKSGEKTTKITFDDSLLMDINDNNLNKFPEKTSLFLGGIEFFKLVFCNNDVLKIFRFPVKCKFKDLNEIKIVSFEHLKIILETKEYKKPYYYSEKKRKYIYINMDDIEKSYIYLDKSIEIKDKETKNYQPKIKSVFNQLNSIYQDINKKEFSYQYISPNFQSYFNKLKINLTDDFHFIHTQNRLNLKSEIAEFLEKNNSSFLYPICGPHGTGKTISILIFHKLLYQDNKKGLYLNLKYYFNNKIKLEDKINILISECFFICDNEEEFLSLCNKFIAKIYISDIFNLISDFIQTKNNKIQENENNEIIENNVIIGNSSETDNNKKKIKENNKSNEVEEINKNKKTAENNKNKEPEENNIQKGNNANNMQKESDINNKQKEINKNNGIGETNKNNETKNKIYIIIDQYQDLYNMKYLFTLFKNIKIILLSSINDFDVKGNLILKYKDENESINIEDNSKKNTIIKYNYIDDLIDNKYYDTEVFKNLIIGKIKKNESNKEQIDKQFKLIYYILKKFAFIPKYFFEYLYYYDSIFDLLFNEYSNIMKKLDSFYINRTIDLNIIEELEENKYLINKEDIKNVRFLQKDRFIENVKLIPLKYINFKACENEYFYFYYSFPLFSKILKDFITFQKDKKLYFTSESGSERGNIFERLIKYQFRVFKKFDLDGYIKVDTIIGMQLTKKYCHNIKKYILSKKNVFIDQKIGGGKDYDFAIYNNTSKKLLLFQAKYTINNGNIQKKSLYENSAKEVLNSFNKMIGKKIGEVHLLYISGIYYNYDNREIVSKILKNNRINCIFYSLKRDLFYLNFKNYINEIELNNSNMLIPSSSEKYEIQEALINLDFEKEEGIYYKYKKTNKKEEEEIESELNEKSGWKSEEEKINKKRKKKSKQIENLDTIIFLQKKTIRNDYDLEKIYKDIITYIHNKSKFKNQLIINLLGPIKIIKCSDLKINLDKEYVIILDLNEKTLEIDYTKKLGLVIYDNGIHYYIELVENITYESYDELIDNFQMKILFALGEKKNRNK